MNVNDWMRIDGWRERELFRFNCFVESVLISSYMFFNCSEDENIIFIFHFPQFKSIILGHTEMSSTVEYLHLVLFIALSCIWHILKPSEPILYNSTSTAIHSTAAATCNCHGNIVKYVCICTYAVSGLEYYHNLSVSSTRAVVVVLLI